MKPEVTISLDYYDSLCEDSEAFKKIQKNEKFIHYMTWCGLGGLRTSVTSNDERVKEIKETSTKEVDFVRAAKDREINALKEEIESLKKRKHFFSWL